HVTFLNGDALAGRLVIPALSLKTSFGHAELSFAQVRKIRASAAGVGPQFVNSLGMKFVPLPGTGVLVSIWDTRVQDYRAYAQANANVDGSWQNPGYQQAPDHPVVNVSWNDARAFCAWLTQKERAEGKIAKGREYRLPTDEEWTVATGGSDYPWGDQWPPPKGAGNYNASLQLDDYQYTSPVGSFKPNRYGLYDIGGNVCQSCVWFDQGGQISQVVRGSSWEFAARDGLLCSRHDSTTTPPSARGSNLGFRCVLAPVETAP
ncbi:MAG TPA: SUMF1/EgtB/PvdO family nonheme iron enzyme, partial [Chthoniobacteraceae bacterium]|nr:SUMF1/EgtB/PvdO family nonheme iron enzyme [Chthoniobacteraceae bacterium]